MRKNGEVTTVLCQSIWSSAVMLATISACCPANCSIISAAISLGGMMSLLGALNFLASFFNDFKRKLPKNPVKGEYFSQSEGFFSPDLICSNCGLKASFDLIKWSKHCPTLQPSADGF